MTKATQGMYIKLTKKHAANKPLNYGEKAYWAEKLFTYADENRGPDMSRTMNQYAAYNGYDHKPHQLYSLTRKAVAEHHPAIQELKQSTATEDDIESMISKIHYDTVRYSKTEGLKYMLHAGISLAKNQAEDFNHFMSAAELDKAQAEQALFILNEKANEAAKPSVRKTVTNLFSFSAAGITSIASAFKAKKRFAPEID